jgi:hypothetical protein
LLRASIKVNQDVVVNVPFTLKSNLIFNCIGLLPHFIDLLLDYGKTKFVFGFGEYDREPTPSAEFAIVVSGQRHRFVRIRGVEEGLISCVWLICEIWPFHSQIQKILWDEGAVNSIWELNGKMNVHGDRKKAKEENMRSGTKNLKSEEIEWDPS